MTEMVDKKSTLSAVKTRFAPSPTGLMHFGNVRVALFNYLFAKKHAGQFLLRIEDTDLARSELLYQEAILRDLKWLGLNWDEGPFFQSERRDIYDAQYSKLLDAGVLYPCFCSEETLAINRKTQLAGGQPPRYPGTCRYLSAEEIAAKKADGLAWTLRFRVPEHQKIIFNDLIKGPQNFESDNLGDFIVRRQDGSASFMFCNAVDDALMGVTHALRGDDHLTNTPRQILILQALALPIPEYGHFPTILGQDNRPLSKRNGSRSIEELRNEGYLPLSIINYLARLGHYDPEPSFQNLSGLAERFELSRIAKAPAHFDEEQLRFWQKEAMLKLSFEECWNLMDTVVKEMMPTGKERNFIEAVLPNLLLPKEALPWAEVIFNDVIIYPTEIKTILQEAGPDFFITAAEIVKGEIEKTETLIFSEFLNLLKEKTGQKGKGLFFPLRASLTANLHGPELALIWELMEFEKLRHRFLEAARHATHL